MLVEAQASNKHYFCMKCGGLVMSVFVVLSLYAVLLCSIHLVNVFQQKFVGLNCGVRGNSKIMINRLISGVTRNFKKGEGHKLQKPSNESGIFQSLDNICSFSLTGKSKGRLHVTMPSLNTLLCLIQTSGGNTYPTCIPSCIPSTAED